LFLPDPDLKRRIIMKEMTSKERIDAVLTGQPFDRTPFALVDCAAWTCQTEGVSYRQLYSRPDSGAASIVKWTDEFGTDIVSGVAGVFTAWLNAFGCSIDIDKVGCSIDTGSCIDDPDTQIPQLDKSKIREKLLANDFFQGMLRQCENVYKLVGDQKYLFGDIAGPFTDASVMLGTAKFLKLMKKSIMTRNVLNQRK
jgi:uroporphyrinogen-III decarboxylase